MCVYVTLPFLLLSLMLHIQVESFYEERETEAIQRHKVLREQLEQLAEHRLAYLSHSAATANGVQSHIQKGFDHMKHRSYLVPSAEETSGGVQDHSQQASKASFGKTLDGGNPSKKHHLHIPSRYDPEN